MKPYRVLCVTHYTEIAGAETSFLLLLEYLDRDLFEPLVVLPDDGPLTERCRALGIEPIILPLGKLDSWRPATSLLRYIRGVFLLARSIVTWHVDLVHVVLEWSAQYGVVAARLAGRPVVCHVRDLLSHKAYKREFIGLSDSLIANSHAVANVVSKFGFPQERLHTIHNGVDLTRFSPDPDRREAFRKKLGIRNQEWAVGLPSARIHPDKGQGQFIQALRLSKDAGISLHGIVTGRERADSSTDYLADLKRLVTELGLDRDVTFVEFEDDMPGLYDALDLVVAASKAEPFGRTIIEAMAKGKPVVSMAAGGPLEIVQDGTTGYLVPPDDVAALANAMVHLAENPQFAAQLGAAGRKRVEDCFSIEKNVRATEEVYRSLLRTKRND